MEEEKHQAIQEADPGQFHHYQKEKTEGGDTPEVVVVPGHIHPDIDAGRDQGVPMSQVNGAQELVKNHWKADVWEFLD